MQAALEVRFCVILIGLFFWRHCAVQSTCAVPRDTMWIRMILYLDLRRIGTTDVQSCSCRARLSVCLHLKTIIRVLDLIQLIRNAVY